MRFLIAAAMFVVSVFLVLFGLGQRTIWAPPTSVSISVKYSSAGPFAIVPHETLALHPGNPRITVSGNTPTVFISSGREADIFAFIGKSAYVSLPLNKKRTDIESKQFAGVAPGFSPAGSDLWRESTSGSGGASLATSSSNQGAVLIASDGLRNAPDSVSILWPIIHDFTWSNALLGSGLALMVAAIILAILHFSDRRRKRGPQRRLPKAPSGPKYRAKRKVSFAPAKGRRAAGRAKMAIPAGIATIALLSGCSSSAPQALPSATPSPTSVSVAPPVVVASQLKRILAQVADAAKAADDSNNKKYLTPRFTGPALNLREVHYFLRSKDKTIPALPSIVASPLSFSLPAASITWPRSIMAVTDEPGDSALPQLIVLQQHSPRENYQVWYTVRLMPGAKIPAVPSATNGAFPVGPKSLFLKVPPLNLPTAYGDLINKGQSSLSAQLFDVSHDEFFKQMSTNQQQQVTNLKKGKITFTHTLGDANVIGLSTTEAGALVAVYMSDTYLIRPTKTGTAVGVSGQEALILGANGSTKGVRSIYGNMLLFFVPALSEGAKIRLIGVTQGLVSVRGL